LRIASVTAIPATFAFTRAPMSFCFIKVDTDDGSVGYGEACDSYGCTYAGAIAYLVENVYGPLLVGEPLATVDPLSDRLRMFTRRRLGESWAAAHARSGIENALWDVAGRAAETSVSELIGRARDQVEVYASSTFLEELDVAQHVALVMPLVERGVRYVKVRIGPDWQDDIVKLGALQNELPGVEMMVDGSETFTLPTALRIADRLSELGIAWFEEPIPQHHRRAIDELGRRSPVPIAYGEHMFGRDDAIDCLTRGQASVLQPDASTCGGISEARAMAQLAPTYGARVVPHSCAGPVSFAANVVVAATVPNIRLLEYPVQLGAAWREFAPDASFGVDSIVDGFIDVPPGAGLGVDVDESRLRAHPYQLPGTRVAGTRSGLPDRFVGDR
jgi:D-galactarolactone cycloisomerase